MKKRRTPFRFFPLATYTPSGKAAMYTLVFSGVYLVAEIILRYKFENTVSTFEIVHLFLLYAAFGFFRKLFSSGKPPVNLKGEPLPVSSDTEARRTRNDYYKKSSLIYAAVFAGIMLFAAVMSAKAYGIHSMEGLIFGKEIPNFFISLFFTALSFVFVYALSYMVEYLWNEYKAARINDALSDVDEVTEGEYEAETEAEQEECTETETAEIAKTEQE